MQSSAIFVLQYRTDGQRTCLRGNEDVGTWKDWEDSTFSGHSIVAGERKTEGKLAWHRKRRIRYQVQYLKSMRQRKSCFHRTSELRCVRSAYAASVTTNNKPLIPSNNKLFDMTYTHIDCLKNPIMQICREGRHETGDLRMLRVMLDQAYVCKAHIQL